MSIPFEMLLLRPPRVAVVQAVDRQAGGGVAFVLDAVVVELAGDAMLGAEEGDQLDAAAL